MANNLKVGYARVNITPPMGVNIAGYFKERIADGVLDELEACAVALSSGDATAIVMTIDHCGLVKDFLNVWREDIEKATGVKKEAIFIWISGWFHLQMDTSCGYPPVRTVTAPMPSIFWSRRRSMRTAP